MHFWITDISIRLARDTKFRERVSSCKISKIHKHNRLCTQSINHATNTTHPDCFASIRGMKADRSRHVCDFGLRYDARKGVISAIIISARKAEGIEYVTDRNIRTRWDCQLWKGTRARGCIMRIISHRHRKWLACRTLPRIVICCAEWSESASVNSHRLPNLKFPSYIGSSQRACRNS